MVFTPPMFGSWLSATHVTNGETNGGSLHRTVLDPYQRRKGESLRGASGVGERVVIGHQGGQFGQRVQPEQAAGQGLLVALEEPPWAAAQVGHLKSVGEGGPYVVVDAVPDVQQGPRWAAGLVDAAGEELGGRLLDAPQRGDADHVDVQAERGELLAGGGRLVAGRPDVEALPAEGGQALP